MSTLRVLFFVLTMSASNLSAAGYSDGSWDYKLPDEIGNLFKTKEKTDRQYGRAGQLLKDETYAYTYDEVGNLTQKESITDRWRYKWSQSGMLKKVLRPDGNHVDFTYDALGRRLTKTFKEETTHFVWDGNVPLHEWTSIIDGTISSINEKGEKELNVPENLTTWVFEDGTFIPMAKLQDGKSYSIITDHLGTPTEAFDEEGDKVWSRELGIYGQTRKETGFENFVPFLYQGQYLDTETNLAYNRFRYYSPESGTYVSQDPIGLSGRMPNMYSYVFDLNRQLDPLGLEIITEGSVFRGLNPKQAAYSPSSRDIGHYKKTGKMPGISTFDDVGTVKGINNKFKLGMEEALDIDVSKLGGDLVADLDSPNGHVSIKPSDDYVKKNFGGDMVAALEDWKAGGDDHILSKNVQNAVIGKACL